MARVTRTADSRVVLSVGRIAAALGVLCVCLFSLAASAVAPGPKPVSASVIPTGWTTYHHDNTRDGYDPNAPSFSGGPFSNWDKTLDCAVYAEPLALSGVVYVATMCNSIYAFDVQTGTLKWSQVALASSANGTHCSMGGSIGIMGTPVIDPAAGVIYAVGLTSTTLYKMFAFNIADGSAVTGFPVSLSVSAQYQNQRAALTLANGHVYVPFGGWIGDCGTYHPNIVSVNVSGTPAQDHQFQPQTGCQNGAGMWGASGMAADGSGNLYATSGNSTDGGSCMGATSYPCTNSKWDFGNGVFKLSSTLGVLDYWAPDNSAQSWCGLNVADTDIGSLGPALLPNGEIFQTGKSGYGWLLNTAGFGTHFNTQQYQNQIGTCSPDAVFGGVAYYAGRVYVPCDGVGLVAFRVNTTTHTFSHTPDWVQAVDPGPPIAAMGLIWVRDQGGSSLYGFDPVTGTQRVKAALGGGSNHFATPAEDGGWVFVGHGNHLRAFNFNIPPCTSATSSNWFASCSNESYTLTGSNGSTWTDMDTTTPLSVTFTPSVASYAVLSANTSLFTSRVGYNQDIGISVSGGAFPLAAGQPEAWKESGGAALNAPNAAYVQAVIPVASGTQYTARLQWKTNVADPYSIWAGAGPIPGQGFSPTRITAMLVPQSAGTVFSKTSTQHYSLTGSDGSAWNDIDATNLSLSFTPPAGNWLAYVGGNADMWTQNAGYNQDLGVTVSGGAYPTAVGQPETWKESGGGGTFAPNAAFAQVPLAVAGTSTYTARLQWKSNRADPGTIEAGAGPVNAAYSPTSIVVVLVPSPSGGSATPSTQAYTNTGSNGSTWKAVDVTNLQLTITPGSTANYLLSGNADLFTRTAGYNQDLGIMISGGTFGTGTVVAWEESGGGFAFSPNAAFTEVDVSLPSGSTYTVTLVWKSNRAAPGVTLQIGAGPISSAYSPTWLAETVLP